MLLAGPTWVSHSKHKVVSLVTRYKRRGGVAGIDKKLRFTRLELHPVVTVTVELTV